MSDIASKMARFGAWVIAAAILVAVVHLGKGVPVGGDTIGVFLLGLGSLVASAYLRRTRNVPEDVGNTVTTVAGDLTSATIGYVGSPAGQSDARAA